MGKIRDLLVATVAVCGFLWEGMEPYAAAGVGMEYRR